MDDPIAAAPALIRMVGPDHALVVAGGDTISALGTREWSLPEPMLHLAGVIAAGVPLLGSLGGAPSGGLVRLTDHARSLLNEYGATIGGDGAVMGVVRGADGRFAGVLGFEPVGRIAQVAPNVPALVAALAVQAQLIAIERKLADIQTDVATLVRESHIEVLAEARAALEILEDVHGDVAAGGHLTADDWDRLVPLELPVRKLHQQATAHLRDLDRVLAEVDGGMSDRLRALRAAARHGRAGFWFNTYVVAETALARWDYLRLLHLAEQDDPRLEREVRQVEDALRQRREFVVGLTRRLSDYLSGAGRVEGVLQRVRIIARARLEQLILDLDGMLGAYREWVGAEPEQTSALPATPVAPPAIAPTEAEDPTWASLVEQARRHTGTVVRRAGDIADRATNLVRRKPED